MEDGKQEESSLAVDASDKSKLTFSTQETPYYSRRRCRRVQIAPVELFTYKSLDVMEKKTPELAEDQEPSETLELEQCDGCRELKQQYNVLFKVQLEVKRSMEYVRREHELKSRECHEVRSKLHQLQTELMQRSMHVGSLALAVEGQVKEKARWFPSIEELSEKFKILKKEHAKLLEDATESRRCLAEMTQMSTTILSAVEHHAHLERELKDLKFKYAKEAMERKNLYNDVLELKGNIRVFCRCRPLDAEEIAGGAIMAVDFESAKDGELGVKSSHGSFKKVFKFDSIFTPEDTQEKVFEKTAPLAVSVLDGYNVCIFAYGQTGTGKTFTMEGTEGARGVNYKTLEEMFRVIRLREGLFRYEVSVSILEVYNEQIHDLLLTGSQPGVAAKRLEVRQVAEGVHHVPGLVEFHVSNMKEVWNVLQTGSKARAVSSTNANEHSSRSHCMNCVIVKGENLLNKEVTESKLWLIDLSGSERVAKTDAQGDRLKEAQSINKSLSALGDVISALATRSTHIPFRNSKLTQLLQDSLGGDSKTLMFVQISPNENDVGETLCSLNFASRVRGVELGPAKKQVDGYRQMVEKVKQEIKNKDGQMKKMEETIHYLELKNKEKDLINKTLQDKVKELESQLLIERKLARQHVDTKIAENQHIQKQKQNQQEAGNYSIHGAISKPWLEIKRGKFAENSILTDNYCKKPAPLPQPDVRNIAFPKDKENKPTLTEEHVTRNASRTIPLYPSSPEIPATRRNSLIPLARHMPSSASRRNSLIPLPTAEIRAPEVSPLSQKHSPFADNNNNKRDIQCGDVNKAGSHLQTSAKKINSVLRRSLQKKIMIRSPLPQTVKRRTVAGLENVRVSIGSGRGAGRVVVGDGSRTAEKGQQQKWKEKEKGWNHGTIVKNMYY